MVEHVDQGLDVAADAPKLAHGLGLGRSVTGHGLQPVQGGAGAGERCRDRLGIGGYAQAPLVVERGERAEPAYAKAAGL